MGLGTWHDKILIRTYVANPDILSSTALSSQYQSLLEIERRRFTQNSSGMTRRRPSNTVCGRLGKSSVSVSTLSRQLNRTSVPMFHFLRTAVQKLEGIGERQTLFVIPVIVRRC
jgi:hypothetical protein